MDGNNKTCCKFDVCPCHILPPNMSRDPVLQTTLLRQLVTHLPGKFDDDERKQHGHTKRVDVYGMCVMFSFYVWISWRCGTEVPQEIPQVPQVPCVICQAFGTIIALYNFYVEFYILPRGTKDAEDDFYVTYGPFGRWVYLTHQTIGILAIHSIVSVFSPYWSRRLASGTYAATPIVGANGIFVTVQYFNLVYPQSEHKQICRLWAQRGIRFGFIDSMRHALPMLVVVLDVLAKQRATVPFAMPSAYGIIRVNVLYAFLFVCLTHLNYSITGYWQYSFMKTLGQNPKKWAAFIAVQGSILSACGLSVSLLSRLVSFW